MVKNWIDTQSFKARGMAKNALGSLLFLDQWVRRQAAAAAVEKVRTLIRQLAHLTGMPLNLRDAGIDDNLAKMDQLIHTALEDGSMLYNPVEPTREAVEKIVEKLYAAKLNPLPVSASDLAPPSQYRGRKGLTNVFTDAEMLYDILGDFYSELADNPDIGPKLLATDLCIRFIYKDPAAIITIDARGKTLKIKRGESEGRPEVTMTMNADFAHLFWHGKANLVTALTRRQVVAKGNVPKTIKLLPILKPAYELYPKFLKARGLERLVL